MTEPPSSFVFLLDSASYLNDSRLGFCILSRLEVAVQEFSDHPVRARRIDTEAELVRRV
jgi:hypothetical protein